MLKKLMGRPATRLVKGRGAVRRRRGGKIINLDSVSLSFGPDERAYLPVDVCGKDVMGLLDCGAGRAIMGGPGWALLRRLGFKISCLDVAGVRLADKRFKKALGSVDVPYKVGSGPDAQVYVVPTLVVPALPHMLILGVNFWKITGLIPDLCEGKAYLREGVPELAELVMEPTSNSTNTDRLSPEERAKVDKLIAKYKPTLGSPTPGCTNLVSHKVDTGDAEPHKAKYFSYSPKILEVLHSGLDELLRQDLVEPSESAWSSNVIVINKPGKKPRWVLDYRQLNKVTKKDGYPLPKVTDILDQLREAKYITSLDLKSAYHQIPLDDASKEKTAFTVRGRGLYQWKRMPQGLHNAPATWQRFIDKVIGQDLVPNVFVYLDDIIVVSKTFEEHMKILDIVLSRLEKAGLTLSLDKCKWVMPKLKYLGYVVDENGLHVDPDKVADIINYPRPKTSSQVRRFVGVCSWYRRFVPNFSSIMSPLTKLTGKKIKWHWGPDCEEAFITMKNKLVSAPILACPDFDQEFDLLCDASGTGIACILSQVQNGTERIIACASRSLSKTERKYSPTELECLAVLFGIDKFRPYIEGYHFTVVTDHASLKWLDNIKDPTGRLGRWALKMQQYDFTIIHRKGTDNVVPDAFSRLYEDVPLDLISVGDGPVKDEWYANLCNAVENNPEKYPAFCLKEGQLYKYISVGKKSPYQYVRVIPENLRKKILEECHDSAIGGHFGVDKTWNRVRQLYYFPRMKQFIRAYISKCHLCIAHKPILARPAGLMGCQRTATKPWEVISGDLMGPFPRTTSGFIYLLVVTDLFSKYVLVHPLKKADGRSVVSFFERHVILKFGAPRLLLFDNGKQFKNILMNDLVEKYHVTILYNFYYHPQANPTERANQVLKRLLATYVSEYVKRHKNLKHPHRNWDKYLFELQAALNSAVHEVTGYRPHRLLYGEELCLDGRLRNLKVPEGPYVPEIGSREDQVQRLEVLKDIYTDVVERLKKAYEKNSRIYNLRRREVKYEPGQIVYRRNFVQSSAPDYFMKKLAPKFVGPFTIKSKCGTRGYLLVDSDGNADGPWHVNDLKGTM